MESIDKRYTTSDLKRMMFDYDEALKQLQERLDEKGIKDIKIFLNPDDKFTKEELKEEIISIFNSHLDGESKPLPLLGDSEIRIEIEGGTLVIPPVW